jgi:hypothetical protein
MERSACFYGCDLERWLAQFLAESEQDLDLELNKDVRITLSRWTGIPLDRFPQAPDPNEILPQSARLAFCEHCWDEDARIGQQPYVRSDWLNWTTVHCRRHETFLSAKNRSVHPRSPQITWQEVWACKTSWSIALHLPQRGIRVWSLCCRTPDWLPQCNEQFRSWLERLRNSRDADAKNALNAVLQGWQRSSGKADQSVDRPVLLENRIEILYQASAVLG